MYTIMKFDVLTPLWKVPPARVKLPWHSQNELELDNLTSYKGENLTVISRAVEEDGRIQPWFRRGGPRLDILFGDSQVFTGIPIFYCNTQEPLLFIRQIGPSGCIRIATKRIKD